MGAKQSIVFIINPISGNINKDDVPKWIAQHIDGDVYDYEIRHTQHAGHGHELAQAAIEQGNNIIIAIGGDGTIHEVASALVSTDAILGIIPLGSGNGLARHLRIPLDPIAAMKLIPSGTVLKMDTARVNASFMVATAGLGFDAQVAHRFSELSGRGFLGYVKAIIKELRHYAPIEIVLESGDRKIQGKFFMASIANISQFGNGFAISPLSDVQDGLLEVCLIRKVNVWNMWRIAWAMYRHTLHQLSAVEIFSVDTVTLELPNAVNKIHIDGEPLESDKRVSIQVHPKSLKVLVPH